MCRWRADASTIEELAQLVERPLCMREVPGSMPGLSKFSAIALGSGYSLGKDHILIYLFVTLILPSLAWRCSSAG